MARKIKIEDDEIKAILAKIVGDLSDKKWLGKINVTYDIRTDERKAKLKITPEAWLKIKALVDEFITEVEWHGLCRRINEFEFELYDVLVFPHEATDITVTSDQKEYDEWIDKIDDEMFDHLKFHGHSHVRMAVHPSPRDMEYRNDILNHLPTPAEGYDVYYIFLIVNKNNDVSGQIYDLTNNAIYDTFDKTMTVMVDLKESLTDFITNAKKIVKTTTYPPSYKSGTVVSSYKDTKKIEDKTEKKNKTVCSSYVSYDGYDEFTDEELDELYNEYGDGWYRYR